MSIPGLKSAWANFAVINVDFLQVEVSCGTEFYITESASAANNEVQK